MADHQDTVRRMADEGHQIGLHTWHHVSLQGMTREEIAAQLGKTQQTIQAVVGPEELMLRPPYGFVDETLKQWAKTPIVCWSVDTEDWKDQNVERIVQTVTQQAEDGDIILMHDKMCIRDRASADFWVSFSAFIKSHSFQGWWKRME